MVETRGREKGDDLFSLLSSFSPAFNSLRPPSPLRCALLSLSSLLRAECVKQFADIWDQTGSLEEPTRGKKKTKKYHRTAEARVSTAGSCFLLRRDRRAAHPGTRASHVTGRRKDPGTFSPLAFPPTTLQSSIFLSRSFPPPPPPLSPPPISYLPSLPAHSSPPHRAAPPAALWMETRV